jgi:prepilin-type processing-associated H-X9-DG protein
MTRHGNPNGLTLAETLFLILICMFVLVILVPMLARRRSTAFRMSCGANLAGIGKAMLIYANDFEDELPRAGGRSSVWTGSIPDWTAPDRYTAYGINRSNGDGGQVSMSASLYLLVKYSEVTPKTFLCRNSRERLEKGMTEFRLGLYRAPVRGAELIDFWDFGPTPWLHCSYSYHMPYGMYALNTSYLPGFAVAADRNPWIASPSAQAGDFTKFQPDLAPFGGTSEQARKGNTPPHDGQGQNVLFLDSHVEFAKRAFCALEDDNIYTLWNGADKLRGTPPALGSQPAHPRDSLLVNDPSVAPK